MSDRAETFARELERINDAVVAFAEDCSNEDWHVL